MHCKGGRPPGFLTIGRIYLANTWALVSGSPPVAMVGELLGVHPSLASILTSIMFDRARAISQIR